MTTDHRHFMELAIAQARLSPPAMAVGVVLVRGDEVLATGYRGEAGPTDHAEAVAIDKATAQGIDLSGTTAYVTLEPCSNLQSKNKVCCADRLAVAGVAEVYIGRYDTNFRVHHQGFKALRDSGITCYDFDADLREEIDKVNKDFPRNFLRRDGLTGRARFDYTQNAGYYDLATDDSPTAQVWKIKFGNRGADTVYVYGEGSGTTARAPFRKSFEEIDKAGAYDFAAHGVHVDVGEIAIIRSELGFALVRVVAVEAMPPHDTAPHVSVTFDYELRPLSMVADGGRVSA